ncbi:MAG: aminoacyl-tRNA hydrolase [Saprospiraceae bacterium]|nr:aminoacyl-tRNA hydrolase [Saprospiraceae bacterium]
MKYLIAGLGNYDVDYVDTRHNIGFDVVDELVQSLGIDFGPGHLAKVASGKYKGKQLTIIKPTTYMNLSGKAIRNFLVKDKIDIENLLVITDDLHIPYGSIRLRPNGTAGGHNGLQNIQDELQTNKYSRLRIGIGSSFPMGSQVDYVLGKWTAKEAFVRPQITKLASEAIIEFIIRYQSSYESFQFI